MISNLRHLEYVVTVARRGSLVEAATELNVSQSAVSAAIKAWEADIGYDIFLRRPSKRLEITTLGREFVDHANVFLEQASEFSHISKRLKDSESGTVAVSCFSSFAEQLLPPLIKRLKHTHPGLELLIHEDDHFSMVRKLRSGKAQVGLTYDLARHRDIAFTPLAVSEPTVMMSTDHPRAGGAAVSLADFVDEEFVELEMPLIIEHGLGLFTANGLQPPIIRPVRSISLLLGLVRQGLCTSIGFYPPSRHRGAHDGFVCVPIADPVPTHRLVAATYRPMIPTRRVNAVIDACRQVIVDAG